MTVFIVVGSRAVPVVYLAAYCDCVYCSRVSSCAGRVPGYACSEATVEQIVDGFHEQEVRFLVVFNFYLLQMNCNVLKKLQLHSM